MPDSVIIHFSTSEWVKLSSVHSHTSIQPLQTAWQSSSAIHNTLPTTLHCALSDRRRKAHTACAYTMGMVGGHTSKFSDQSLQTFRNGQSKIDNTLYSHYTVGNWRQLKLSCASLIQTHTTDRPGEVQEGEMEGTTNTSYTTYIIQTSEVIYALHSK